MILMTNMKRVCGEPVKAKPVKTQRQPVSQENDYEEPAPKQRSGFLGSKPKVVRMTAR